MAKCPFACTLPLLAYPYWVYFMKHYSTRLWTNDSDPPPAAAGVFFDVTCGILHEPCGLPLHNQTGVWCFVRLNKKPAISNGFCTSLDCVGLCSGGAEGDRTPGLMTASHALSQLSYSPTNLY
jgi:hypothetical protein